MEFDYPEIYAPLDLGIGRCRVSVAEPAETAGTDDPARWSRVTVATKYPNIARRHFAARGVQAEVVQLNGAMELAPSLGLSRLIVDLVQTGGTLAANGLVETETIAHVTSRLIVNRTALKTRPERIGAWIARLRAALSAALRRLSTADPGFEAAFAALLDAPREETARVDARGRGDHRRGARRRRPRPARPHRPLRRPRAGKRRGAPGHRRRDRRRRLPASHPR